MYDLTSCSRGIRAIPWLCPLGAISPCSRASFTPRRGSGVLVPGETFILLEEPTGTPWSCWTGTGDLDARGLGADVLAAVEHLDLRERAVQVFAGNVAPDAPHLTSHQH